MKLPPKSNRLYLVIKELLTEKVEYRDSDKKLLWAVWEKEGHVVGGKLSYGDWLSPSLTSSESIRRTRQKIQEKDPSLQASPRIQALRKRRQKTKGTFVYREPFVLVDPLGIVKN
jgi:hypothetical protein